MTTTDLCQPCYWGECLNTDHVCLDATCICRCASRRKVSDTHNLYLRRQIAQALRRELYGVIMPADGGLYFTPEFTRGFLYAAMMIEDGDI